MSEERKAAAPAAAPLADEAAPPAVEEPEAARAARPPSEVGSEAELVAGSMRIKPDYSVVFGLAFWSVLIGGGVFWALHSEHATLLLNVTSMDPLQVSGAVTYEGQIASEGTVQLRVLDALEHSYLSSKTLTLGPGGRFSSDAAMPLAPSIPGQKLQIEASFYGRTAAATAKDSKPLVASETLYVNFTPMLDPAAKWFAACLVVPFLTLIFLFTGPLTRQKARLLFMITYAVTLFSCLIPIGLTFWVSRNPYLIEVMERAPVGLLKGTGKGMENPQWLVNIGGAVIPPRVGPSNAPKSKTPAEAVLAEPLPVASPSPAPTTPSVAEIPVVDRFAQVKGGLTIPLFVVMLATLGAGINMTRKVPEIQKDYDSVAITFGDAVRAPIAVFSRASEPVEKGDAARIRQSLIETYMYFLSAPFLAIAVYYLLQVIATSVAEPVLVVIAFATGLMSNTVVGSIIAFADATLKRAQSPGNSGAPPAKPEPLKPA